MCTTTASTVGATGLITVAFDGALRSSTDNFTFQPNPKVIDIQPRSSIESGGRKLTISGTDLTVSRAAIFVQHKDVDDNTIENIFKEVSQILMSPFSVGMSLIVLLYFIRFLAQNF